MGVPQITNFPFVWFGIFRGRPFFLVWDPFEIIHFVKLFHKHNPFWVPPFMEFFTCLIIYISMVAPLANPNPKN